jgi:hypothetical protein
VLRRLLPLGVLLAAAAGGCGSSSPSFNLADATAATTRAGTTRVAVAERMTLPGVGPLALHGTGAIDLRRHRGWLSIDMSSFARVLHQPAARLRAREIMDGLVFYMRFPLLDGRLPPGIKWLKLDLGKAGQQLGIDFGSILRGSGGIDPSQYLAQLRAAGKVENRGATTVRGVPTTHYHATLSFAKLPATLPAKERAAARRSLRRIMQLTGTRSVPLDVWLDRRDRVRRLTTSYTSHSPGAPALHTAVTIDMYGFGVPVAVAPPPAAQTRDVTAAAAAVSPY